MVPGFMKFAQDDQIALLKRGKNIIIVRILHTFNMRNLQQPYFIGLIIMKIINSL